MASSSDQPALNDCGCCEGVTVETPTHVENRPGLPAIAYRIGTYERFKRSLLARLSGSRQPDLNALTTRDDTDFTIALLDAAAVVGDVLTFYQERLANESYLRTATERLSVLELARLIDYQLRPGVAASTFLAFTLEDAPGTLGQALSLGTTAQSSSESLPPLIVEAGVKVQSVPAPGEQAQTFETIEAIEARPEWNAMRPRLSQPQTEATGFLSSAVILQGTATGVRVGDALLVQQTSGNALRTVVRVRIDDDAQTTRADFVSDDAPLPPYVRPAGLPVGSIDDFPPKQELVDSVADHIVQTSWTDEDLSALANVQGWRKDDLVTSIARRAAALAQVPTVLAFRQRAAIFGHNAPAHFSLLKADGTPIYPQDWDSGFEIWKDPMTASGSAVYWANADLYIDHNVPDLPLNSIVVLQRRTSTGVEFNFYRIREAFDDSPIGFGIGGKTTGLRLSTLAGTALQNNVTDKPAAFTVRTTTLFLLSEPLALADVSVGDIVSGDTVTLERTFLGLKTGQHVVLTGERDDLNGAAASEKRDLKEVIVEGGFTVLRLDRPLDHVYRRQRPRAAGETARKTVTINANVAAATHGDTVREVLGSGDGSVPFQRFTLRQPPLTYVSAPTPSGAASTLQVRVSDVLWHEVPSFHDHEPHERIYVTRFDDAGRSTVVFGDGESGARPATGQENVAVTYRKGIGLAGQLPADRLTQLATRPLGLKGVTNPVPATGAADPEPRDEARRNAPLTVRTFGRVVSLEDYQDFARAFSGIEKALATWTWFGERRGVFLTVAGANGAEVAADSVLYRNLLDALQASGDDAVPLLVRSYRPRLFRVSALLQIDPDLLAEKVVDAVTVALATSFSFAARDFGQPVHFSEVVGVMQNVDGVLSVDVDEFHRSDLPAGPKPEPHIPSAVPRPGASAILPAELVTLDPRPLDLRVRT
jgi:hypothetical protein